MPKRVHEINPFHGGINSKDDQRDITDTQLVEALNVKADSKGTLKLIGNPVQGSTAWPDAADSSSGVHPGFGFFRFSSDANAAGASGTDDNNTHYLIAWSEQVGKFYWWDGSAWAIIVDLSSTWATDGGSGGGKPVYSYANGALRITDSNFNNTTNANHWLGYIERRIFRASNANSTIAQWFDTTAALAAPSTPVAINSALISSDSDTNAEDVSWVISNARLNTTLVAALSDDDNSISDTDTWHESSNGTNTTETSGGQEAELSYRATSVANEHPYDAGQPVRDYRIASNLTGDDIWSESGWVRLNTDNGDDFTSAFTIPTTGSVYVTVKLPDQATFDAWNGGFAASSETTVIFRNLKFVLWNGTDSLPTTNYISWNVPVSKLSVNETEWFVLEFPYDQAIHNDLSGTSINQIEFGWDVTVEKSGSDSFSSAYSTYSNMSALYACDVRTGDEGQVGSDLLGNRQFAYSFTYDDKKSESLLTDLGIINMGVAENSYANLIQAGAISFTNKRISGATLYAYEEDIPYMIAELDFVKGLRGSWDVEWPGTDSSTSQWTSVGSNSVKSNVVYNDSIPLIESYQSRNGFNHKQDSIDSRYKSIVITNNRAYVGNVYIDGTHYPDRMIKSQAFDYDAFPEEGRSIEVVQQDGDSIVALAAYADRLFQFKNNKLHIINITSEQEFLEDSHTGLGVQYPYHVVSMSTGIAWMNKNGAYYFDGQKINNITNGLIDDETWATHVTSAGVKAQIFYVPKQDKLICVGGTDGVDLYEYTIYTGGWTRGEDIFENTKYTNFALDIDNEVKTFKLDDGYWHSWSDASTLVKDDYRIITGDLVFDSSAVRKKIYRVHVTHRLAGGTDVFETFGRADRAGVWTNLGALNNYSDFSVQEFDVSGVNNARSYQVKVEARNLVTNGYFGTDTTGWQSNNRAVLSINDQKLRITSNAVSGNAIGYYEFTAVIGETYRVKADFIAGTDQGAKISVGKTDALGTGVYQGGTTAMTTDTTANFTFTAIDTTQVVWLYQAETDDANGEYHEWDNIFVKAENIPTDFEINDINVVFRSKNVR